MLNACGPEDGASLSPEGAASNEYWFESLPQMVATSDDVVLGAVSNAVLLFAKVNTDPGAEGRYYPINEQSVYLVSGTDVQATTDHDLFSKEVAAMTLDEIREKVEEAAEAIAAGDVKPQEPAGG